MELKSINYKHRYRIYLTPDFSVSTDYMPNLFHRIMIKAILGFTFKINN